MESYIKELKQNGMQDQEAIQKAIIDRGDPDEAGKALRKSYNPYIGWLCVISKWILIGSLFFFLLTILTDGNIYDAFQHYNTSDSSFYEEIYQNSEDETTQTIMLSSEQKAKLNGYRISLKRAAIRRLDDQTVKVFFTLHTTFSMFKQPPDGIRYYIKAIDSNGNEYTSMLDQTENRKVEGNPSNQTLTSCDYEMWIHDVDQTAAWIDICYERFNQTFKFRITLKQGA